MPLSYILLALIHPKVFEKKIPGVGLNLLIIY